ADNEDKDKVKRELQLKQYRDNLRDKEEELRKLRFQRDSKRKNSAEQDRLTNERKFMQAQLEMAARKTRLLDIVSRRDDAQLDLSVLEGKLSQLSTLAAPADRLEDALRNDPSAQLIYKKMADVDAKIQQYRDNANAAFAEQYLHKE